MKTSVLKIPFGPEVTLYEGEFFAITRHRIMLFFYFGLACMILISSMGRRSPLAQPELVLGLAAVEILVGLVVVVLCKLLALWRAARTSTVPRVEMGRVLIATVTLSVASAEFFNPFLFGAPGSTLVQFGMKLVFYVTLTELLTSIMLQYTLGYILADLRKDKSFSPDGLLLPPSQETGA